MDEKQEFLKIAVKAEIKHEIAVIAATERRFVYEVVEDMLKLYKQVAFGKTKKMPPAKSRNGKNKQSPSEVASMIAEHS